MSRVDDGGIRLNLLARAEVARREETKMDKRDMVMKLFRGDLKWKSEWRRDQALVGKRENRRDEVNEEYESKKGVDPWRGEKV